MFTTEQVIAMLRAMLPSGSGFDAAWNFTQRGDKILARSSFHAMDDGFYVGWVYFTVTLNIVDGILVTNDFTFRLDDDSSANICAYCGSLDDYIETMIAESLTAPVVA